MDLQEAADEYQNAVNDYRSIIDGYASEKIDASGNLFGEEALMKAIILANEMKQNTDLKELCKEFEENYPNSKKHIDDYCLEDYELSSIEGSAVSFLINGRIKTIAFKGITEPSFDEYGVKIIGENKVQEAEEKYNELKEYFSDILSLLKILENKKTGLEYLEALLRYIINATDKITKDDLQKAIKTIPQGGNIMPTIAETWIEEGYQKGIQEGIQKGIQKGIKEGIQEGILEGLTEGIELALELKFGAKGTKLMPAIKKIKDINHLKAIKETIKTAANISEIKKII